MTCRARKLIQLAASARHHCLTIDICLGACGKIQRNRLLSCKVILKMQEWKSVHKQFATDCTRVAAEVSNPHRSHSCPLIIKNGDWNLQSNMNYGPVKTGKRLLKFFLLLFLDVNVILQLMS